MLKLHLLPDLKALSFEAAEIFVDLSKHCIASKGQFFVAVSGGSTPIRLYTLLGSDMYSHQIDWRRLHFFWVDERFVPPSHKDSNYRLLHDYLLSKISIPRENIHPVKTDLPSPQVTASNYEESIKNSFRLAEGSLPAFDLILLGIGEDGHTASLFPDNEALKETKHLVVSVRDSKHVHHRISLTLPVINGAETVIFLVSGKNKADVVKKVLVEKDSSLPASLVNPEKGNLIFLIDKEAALYLKNI
ncbi:MAG: 6-phosphogluconolactonase [Nitrospirae bacterium RBG_13_43_8]|nr:MAG: 6-phosphogluconolactonase [Nitrospirae bacterium RBG_13_43_8]